MKVITQKIKYKYGDIIKIKPISDVHYGNQYCDIKAFKDYMKSEDDEKTYFIGIGDLYDSILPSDPRYIKHADGLEDTAVLDQAINQMVEILEPYKDRIIGIGRGNHESQILKRHGTDSIKRTANRLGVPNLGYSGLIRLVLSEGTGRGRTVVIRYHHGWGGGSRTQGADLTKYAKDPNHWDADVFVYGHVHKKQYDEIDRLGLSGETLISRNKIICICGTFLKTYSTTADSTYSEENGYPPVSIGGLVIHIRPSREWVRISVTK